MGIALVVASLSGCGDDGGPQLIDGLFTEAEWTKVSAFELTEPPLPNSTNRFADDDAAAALGQRMFFEKRYSGPLLVASDLGAIGETGKVACATCHISTAFFSDNRPGIRYSTGADTPRRNTPSLVNVVYYDWGNWAGAHDQFWKQGAGSPETGNNTNGTRLDVAHVIYDHYKADYEAVFGPLDPALDPAHPDAARFPPTGKPKASGAPDGAWELMTPEDRIIINTIEANVGKSFEAYERKLISRNSPLDRYIAGDTAALSLQAKRGLKLFIGKAACDACHDGPTFSNQDFHNTGVMQDGATPDEGQFTDLPRALTNTWNGASIYSDDPVAGAAKLAGLMATEDMKGKFRTKSLRHLTETAPYFHDGSMATLEDVVRYYNTGGGTTGFPGVKDPLLVPLALTNAEIGDLVAFLESLTGDPVPAALTTDTSAP